MSDKEIISELKKGNEYCLKYLYVHLNLVKRWVMRNNGGEDEAKDLFQEAIIVFYKNLMQDKYEHRSKISTYLFEICRRQWLNHLNRKANVEIPKGNINDFDKRKYELKVEENNENSLKKYLDVALAKLGEPCKSLIEATVCFKKKMEAVAKEFGYSSAQSARQQKLRCIKRLRDHVSYEVVLQLI